MQTQQAQTRALPTPPDGNALQFRLFRALLAVCKAENLSFPILDAEVSGKRMLNVLSDALQYVLPFDDAELSPLRLDGRVHLIIPDRFKTKARYPSLTPALHMHQPAQLAHHLPTSLPTTTTPTTARLRKPQGDATPRHAITVPQQYR